jgi:hypothetical protein
MEDEQWVVLIALPSYGYNGKLVTLRLVMLAFTKITGRRYFEKYVLCRVQRDGPETDRRQQRHGIKQVSVPGAASRNRG